jgi:RNA polymerase sigma factor (sigma-70 family)
MFGSVGEVTKVLKAFRGHYDPKSVSVLVASNRTTDVDADPFRRGFLDSMDLRTELLKRLASLDELQRAVILLWYLKDLPVKSICEQLNVSRSNCYRLRDRALAMMLDPVVEIQEAFA